ncbi:hypothetical protein C2W62_20445 [Candidatus Entotheonella serta]|nr:hypothetical protein C2W62_20445 [Candidatus Entotheonella serta]
MKHPGIAAVLSAIILGVGQIYNGNFFWAIFWFIITPGLWIGSGGVLGWICHILSAYFAYRTAKKNESASSTQMQA